MPGGRAIAKGVGGIAAALAGGAAVLLIGGWAWGDERAPPDPASDPIYRDTDEETAKIPNATLGEVAALSPAARAEFMRGYFSALAAFDVPRAGCARVWFYDLGGAGLLEQDITGPLSDDKRSWPMGTYIRANIAVPCRDKR